jgi:hypothetical protein
MSLLRVVKCILRTGCTDCLNGFTCKCPCHYGAPWHKPPKRLTPAQERVEAMERKLRYNPRTGELLVTRRYKDAVIDYIMERVPEPMVNHEERLCRVEKYLRAIMALGGNLPDERFVTRTGPNDAKLRGEMYVQARQLATEALRIVVGVGV